MQSISKKAIVISAIALVALVGCCGIYNANSSDLHAKVKVQDPLQAEFAAWTVAHNKKYGAAESQVRFTVWKANHAKVHTHNAKNSSYTLAVNKFADLTRQEFSSIYLGAQKDVKAVDCPAPSLQSTGDVAAAVDWRTKGRVNKVKNQGQCGSCWAFSTVAGLEGLYARDHSLLSFSEQQLVDCSGDYGNQGCNGGWVQSGLQYVIAKGITTEDKYPYTAVDGDCKTGLKVAFQPTGCENVKNTVEGLKEALQNGPTPVYVEADQSAFQLYNSGVVDDADCFSEGQIDHAVIAVGYTSDAWIVRNSWGESWGEAGYIRLSTETTNNPQGVCGILSIGAAYPTL